jgi:addiction module HigA family antidote
MSDYKVIDSRGKELSSNVSLHPGEALQWELEARKIKKSIFANSIGMKASHFSELLHGKRHIGAVTALKLENLLGIDAEFWMRVQVSYDLFEARKKTDISRKKGAVKGIASAAKRKAG